jgi:biofilm PGA synthesis N-glycosyltransferase PgaC
MAPDHILVQAIATISTFVFLYPLLMSYVWMIGSIGFFVGHERRDRRIGPQPLARTPRVSVLVPCFNEEDNVDEVIGQLMHLDYPDYEVIAVNDGSTDRTGELLDALAARHPRLRVIHQGRNQGKAVGLDTAAFAASGEILVGIDGDALLHRDAVGWLVRHFLDAPEVGAVTGNPRIRTRSTLLGRLQVAEFSSIVGLIKRAQQMWLGRLFTVSGVVVAFRRTALHDVGYWSHDMLTEDIDISWKLQTRGWTLRFEPNALVWILMPETLRGLWKQRLRWSMGGVQVVARYAWVLGDPRLWRLWPVLLEYVTSVLWAYLMGLVLAIGLVGLVVELPPGLRQAFLIPGWTGILMAATCVLQFLLSLAMDSRYDVRLHRYLGATIWYPFAFWMLSMATSIWAVPKVLARARGARAVWVSPDRGIQQAGG